MNSYNSYFYVFCLVSNAALGGFFFGYSISYMNVSLETVDFLLKIDKEQKEFIHGLISCIIPFGAGLGALYVPTLLRNNTRKNSMIIADMIGITGLLLSLIDSLPALIIARLIIGFTTGLNSAIVPLYVNESSPPELQGQMGLLLSLNLQGGILTSFLLGQFYTSPPTLGDHYWMFVFIFPIFTCLLRIFGLVGFFNFEPISFYFQDPSSPNIKKARHLIQRIYKPFYTQKIFDQMERQAAQKKLQTKDESLWKGELKFKFFVGCGLSIMQQLAGINAVMFYSTDIFNSVTKNDKQLVQYLNISVPVVGILGCFLSGFLLASYGKKLTLKLGSMVCFITLLIMGIFSQQPEGDLTKLIILASLFLYILSFQSSLGPIFWLYLPEILPEKGISLATLINWWSATLITQLFPLLVSQLGIGKCFLIFSLGCFVQVGFISKYVEDNQIEEAKKPKYVILE